MLLPDPLKKAKLNKKKSAFRLGDNIVLLRPGTNQMAISGAGVAVAPLDAVG